MIIDISYFVTGSLLVTGISATGTGVAAQVAKSKKDNLSYFIAEYEPKFLRLLLGEDLADLFMTELVKTGHDAKWDTLENQLISSMVVGDSTFKYSPIASYVFFYYQRNELIDTTTTGEYEEPQLQSIRNKQINAWNDMVEKVDKFSVWMKDSLSSYPYYIYNGCFETINIFGI